MKIGSISDDDCNEFIKDTFGEKSTFKICSSFGDIKEDSIIVLLNSLGKVSFSNIESLSTRLDLYQKDLFGICIID